MKPTAMHRYEEHLAFDALTDWLPASMRAPTTSISAENSSISTGRRNQVGSERAEISAVPAAMNRRAGFARKFPLRQ